MATGRLGVDDRLVRISEQPSDAVVGAVDAAIVAAGVTGAGAVAARHAERRASAEEQAVSGTRLRSRGDSRRGIRGDFILLG